MSDNKTKFKYGYFEFLLNLNEVELYDIATEIENLCYDEYYINMFNTARRFFECMLWRSCYEYLNIEPVFNEKTEQMIISRTAYTCFERTNSLTFYYSNIKDNIEPLQELSHYNNNSDVSDKEKINLFSFIRNCCIWYVNEVMGIKLNLPKYVIYKDTKLRSDMYDTFLVPYKNEIANLKAELNNLEKENAELKEKYKQTKNDHYVRNPEEDNALVKHYKEIAEYQKKIVSDYYKEIGSIDNCKNIVNKLRDYENVNETIRKQFTKLAKERDILKMQLEKVSLMKNNETESNQTEIVHTIEDPEPIVDVDESLKDSIRRVILLFDSLGCYITMKTVYKYLVGQQGGFTARYNLVNSEGFGMYKPHDLSIFDVTKVLMSFTQDNFIKTEDNRFFNLVK